MSNIFMITGADDLNWLFSDVTKGVFSPVFQAEEVKSPALRMYTAGDRLQTLAMIYNADAKAIARSEIETQTILYKDGKEFMRGESVPLRVENAETLNGIPVFNILTVGTAMPPGDYVLQLIATDKKNGRNNEGATSQTLGFTVVGNKTELIVH